MEENLNQKASPVTKHKAPNLPERGHGEGLTKKNGLVFIKKNKWLHIKKPFV